MGFRGQKAEYRLEKQQRSDCKAFWAHQWPQDLSKTVAIFPDHGGPILIPPVTEGPYWSHQFHIFFSPFRIFFDFGQEVYSIEKKFLLSTQKMDGTLLKWTRSHRKRDRGRRKMMTRQREFIYRQKIIWFLTEIVLGRFFFEVPLCVLVTYVLQRHPTIFDWVSKKIHFRTNCKMTFLKSSSFSVWNLFTEGRQGRRRSIERKEAKNLCKVIRKKGYISL